MPTEHILALLIAERDKLNRAIEALGGTGTNAGAVRGKIPTKQLLPFLRLLFRETNTT
jgi:hypothetical protein